MQTETVETGGLYARVAVLASWGYRLVQISCTKTDSGMELTYSFEKDYEILHLRTYWTEDGTIPSIQALYWCAFIYENEIAELFGVTVADMAVDFKGQLYKTARPSPFGAGITIQEA
ncbi:ech hydrogenase subunit D [Sporobacter termitidis DSM 10068]|uniref:Ech hydrogenase subunit D n=2 Tax=Sporobacter TaxID=44748 RepID=A0A1M5Z0Q4_9FIRM|nr:ech hydrogenase subunit D [Sporobacter termitidis DSM 10068]